MLKRGFGIISPIKTIQRSYQRLTLSANQNALFLTRAKSTKLMSLDSVHSILQEQGAEDICCVKVPKVGFLLSDWLV